MLRNLRKSRFILLPFLAASIVSPSSPAASNAPMSAAAAVAMALNNFPPAAGNTNGHQLHVTSGGSAIKLEGGGGSSVASIAGCGSVSSVTSSGNAAYYNTFAAASPEPNNHALLTATGGSYSTSQLSINMSLKRMSMSTPK